MIKLNRRHALGLMGATAGGLLLPSYVRAQGARPSVTIAVQKLTINNTLDPWNEQSNVAERVMYPNLWEGLILRDWMGDQGPVPGLATSWKRIDDKTLELTLREGVKFHNGDEMTAEDVAFSFSKDRLFGDSEPAGGKTIFAEDYARTTAKDLPPDLAVVGRGRGRRQIHRPLPQRDARCHDGGPPLRHGQPDPEPPRLGRSRNL